MEDYCESNPCFAGVCTSVTDNYNCDCTGTGRAGDRCEIGKILLDTILHFEILWKHDFHLFESGFFLHKILILGKQ